MARASRIDTSRMFDLLADGVRRRLLIQLCDEETVEIPDGVMVRGGARARSVPDGGRSPGTVLEASGRERLSVELHHNHLPMLESHGLIQWDREAATVSRGQAFGEVEPFLHLLSANAETLPSGLL